MPQIVLTTLKYLFLALLYLFLARAIRVIYLDLVGPRVPKPPPPRPVPGEMPKKKRPAPKSILVTEGEGASRTFPLDDAALTIGRSDGCEITLTDNYASSFHARIFPQESSWFVEDLGSTNGTYLNRVKLTAPAPLSAGDEIRIGKTTLEARR